MTQSWASVRERDRQGKERVICLRLQSVPWKPQNLLGVRTGWDLVSCSGHWESSPLQLAVVLPSHWLQQHRSQKRAPVLFWGSWKNSSESTLAFQAESGIRGIRDIRRCLDRRGGCLSLFSGHLILKAFPLFGTPDLVCFVPLVPTTAESKHRAC